MFVADHITMFMSLQDLQKSLMALLVFLLCILIFFLAKATCCYFKIFETDEGA